MSSDLTIQSSGAAPATRTTQQPTADSAQLTQAKPTAQVETTRAVEQASDVQEVTQETLEHLVDQINSFADKVSRNLQFSVDDPSGHTVITVTEKNSGDVIRKIPSEEFLAISQHIQDMNSLLFNEKV